MAIQYAEDFQFNPSLAPTTLPSRPLVALQHRSGARVNLLVRPAAFYGWSRSNSDRLPGAIPFQGAAQAVYVSLIVPEMVQHLDLAANSSNQTYVNTYEMRRQHRFERYLPSHINIEVELVREDRSVNFRCQPTCGRDDSHRPPPTQTHSNDLLVLLGGMPDSGLGRVDKLFAHMAANEKQSSGAVRWWPGLVMRYHLVSVDQPANQSVAVATI